VLESKRFGCLTYQPDYPKGRIMPFRIEWYVEGRVIHIVNEGRLTQEDLHQQNVIITPLLDAGVAPIHIITDNTKLVSVPSRLLILTTELRGLQHSSVGWMIFITSQNRVVRFLYRMLTRILRLKYEPAKTLNEALKILHQKDKSLNGNDVLMT
jgi:hypothetical protein